MTPSFCRCAQHAIINAFDDDDVQTREDAIKKIGDFNPAYPGHIDQCPICQKIMDAKIECIDLYTEFVPEETPEPVAQTA